MDQQILETLLKFPKKKHIKKLFQHCLILTHNQKIVSPNFSTPVIQSLHKQVGLTSQEVHRLILSVGNLFKLAALVNFDQQRLENIFGQRLQEQLKELVLELLLSFSEQAKQIETKRARQGKQLDIDNMDWNLATEVGNQKGKSNTPIIELSLPLSQPSNSSVNRVKFEMKKEQFEVFYNNLTKIKQTLNDLVAEG